MNDAKARQRPVFSFEFFPPKNADAVTALEATIRALKPLAPDFCSVTYGAAGGSGRQLTLDIVARIQHEIGINAVAHLTCVDADRAELGRVLGQLRDRGVENVLALRGDPPRGTTGFTQTPGGFRYAHELAAMARDEFGLCVGGAVYPEGHVEERDLALNVQYARQKMLAGCEFFVSQLFFEPKFYFDYVARLRAAGVYTPVLAGIMPITDAQQIERFTKLCGASLPALLRQQLDAAKDDPVATRELGIAYATHQCVRLLEGGAPGIHFYTLNRSASTRAILSALRASFPS